MKYNVIINQLALVDTDLDFIEAAILDYLYFICSSVNPKIEKQRNIDDLGVWTWIDYASLMEDMPLLRIKDKAAITRRLQKIEKEGFIKIKHGKGYRLYIHLTEMVDSLYARVALTKSNTVDTEKSSVDNYQRSQPLAELTIINASVDENGTDNNTSDNNTKNIITNVITEKPVERDKKITANVKEYGNPEINQLIALLKGSLRLNTLDGSVQDNRNFAHLLIKKFGYQECIALIQATSRDQWWKGRVTSTRKLYYNATAIMSNAVGRSYGANKVSIDTSEL